MRSCSPDCNEPDPETCGHGRLVMSESTPGACLCGRLSALVYNKPLSLRLVCLLFTHRQDQKPHSILKTQAYFHNESTAVKVITANMGLGSKIKHALHGDDHTSTTTSNARAPGAYPSEEYLGKSNDNDRWESSAPKHTTTTGTTSGMLVDSYLLPIALADSFL